MTFRIYSYAPAALALLVVSVWTTQVSAQAPAAAPAQPASPAAMIDPAPAAYRSALEGYRPYSDEKIVNWKEANDTAGQIGGWRAYAKEASQGSPSDNAAKPAPGATPAKP